MEDGKITGNDGVIDLNCKRKLNSIAKLVIWLLLVSITQSNLLCLILRLRERADLKYKNVLSSDIALDIAH